MDPVVEWAVWLSGIALLAGIGGHVAKTILMEAKSIWQILQSFNDKK